MALVIPSSYAEVNKTFGEFTYTEAEGGNGDIIVSPSWRRANIVGVKLDGYTRTIWIHKLLADKLRQAWDAAVKACPTYVVDKIGCFAPRHKLHNPEKPLSLHSWGIAVDINPSRNAFGTKGDMPEAFVDAWTRVGWVWGGRFKHGRDPMHYQWAKGI